MLPATYVPGFHDEAAVKAMRYNDLGRTGLKVSPLGLGGAALALFGDYSEEDATAGLHEGIRQGINYIDTAPFYGQGKSEEVLGRMLKGIPRQAYYIATKVARYTWDAATGSDFTAENTKKSVDRSLQLLQLDYVDVIQIHDIEFARDPDVIIRETLPALQECVAAGKARFIGITGYPVVTLKKIVEMSNRVKIDTVLSFARDTLFDDTLQQYIPFFKERGIGVICAAGVAMGLLSNAGPQPWHPASQEVKDSCTKAREYCKEKGVELARLAVHHALTREGQATHLVGFTCAQNVRSNLQTLREGLTPEEKEVMRYIKDKIFANMPKHHWEGVELAEARKTWKKLGLAYKE